MCKLELSFILSRLFLFVFCDAAFGQVNGLGDLDASGTYPGALEMILTRPDAVGLVQIGQSFSKASIPAVVEKTCGLDHRRWAQKLGIFLLNNRTCRIAGGTQNTAGAFVDPLSFLR